VVAEVPEHATLNDALEPGPVLGLEEAGFVKMSLLVVASGEDAVEDDDVEVEVWVQGGAEAVQEAERAELGVGGRTSCSGGTWSLCAITARIDTNHW